MKTNLKSSLAFLLLTVSLQSNAAAIQVDYEGYRGNKLVKSSLVTYGLPLDTPNYRARLSKDIAALRGVTKVNITNLKNLSSPEETIKILSDSTN